MRNMNVHTTFSSSVSSVMILALLFTLCHILVFSDSTLTAVTVAAFSPPLRSKQSHSFSTCASSTSASAIPCLHMFRGAGEGVPAEDADPQELQQMKETAAAMGMSLDEYKLGMRARVRLSKQLDDARVTDSNNGVSVERDANNPPKVLDITITDQGKALGATALSNALCASLKSASAAARQTRSEAQKNMMQYISDEMKKVGSK